MTAAATFRQLWSQVLTPPLRGLVPAREKGWLLAWDAHDWLYLLDRHGKLQAQVRTGGRLAGACCAEDGSAYAAVSVRGEVWRLAPDLMTSWVKVLPHPVVAVALDPFGEYLAAADAGSSLHIFDRHGREVCRVPSPRPLHHLAFVPAAPFLVGSSDYGLVGCLELSGRWVWRDGLVAHIGGLAVAGDGEPIVLACFSEGLQRYSLAGKKQPRQVISEPCRLVAVTFDGRLTLVAGLGNRLQVLDAGGGLLAAEELEQPLVAAALGALGDFSAVAVADGTVRGFELSAG